MYLSHVWLCNKLSDRVKLEESRQMFYVILKIYLFKLTYL